MQIKNQNKIMLEDLNCTMDKTDKAGENYDLLQLRPVKTHCG